MNLELFTPCDYAQDAMGKLTVVGCFDALNVRSLPAKHPFMCIALRMRFMMHELGVHRVQLELMAPDETPLIPPFQGNLEVSGGGTDTTAVNLVLNNIGLEFRSAGKHLIKLSMDGDIVAMAPLYVRIMPS